MSFTKKKTSFPWKKHCRRSLDIYRNITTVQIIECEFTSKNRNINKINIQLSLYYSNSHMSRSTQWNWCRSKQKDINFCCFLLYSYMKCISTDCCFRPPITYKLLWLYLITKILNFMTFHIFSDCLLRVCHDKTVHQ